MAKPRRSTEESFYDVFTDFEVEDQAVALRILEQIHRLARRDRKTLPPQELTPAAGARTGSQGNARAIGDESC